jgi:hypothetical protein
VVFFMEITSFLLDFSILSVCFLTSEEKKSVWVRVTVRKPVWFRGEGYVKFDTNNVTE